MTTYALTIALVLLAAVPASAQDTPLAHARWAPWLGCWTLIQDDRGSLDAATTGPDDVLVCVLPASEGRGVGMTTFVGGRSVVQQSIVADGASHPVSEPACSGSQRSEWSLTGQRLLTRAEVVCSGQAARTVSGITLMTQGPTWVDIQAVGADQDAQVRVRRYRRASSPPEGMVLPPGLQERGEAARARLAGPMTMTLEEVVDASGKIAAPAVEAALLETGSRFDLNSRALRELDAADVPDEVVDVMVALSFPGRFQVDRTRGRATQTQGAIVTSVERSNRLPERYGSARQRRNLPYDTYAPPYTYDPYYPYYSYYPYNPYNPYYGYGAYDRYYFSYSPFGYSNWWGNPYIPYYSGSPRPVVIVPGGPARPGGSGRSRVVEGRGYTQGGTASAPDAPRTDRGAVTGEEQRPNGSGASGTSSRRAVSRRGYSSGGSSSGAGSSSSGGSNSGGGTRSSGSGSRSGRTAQPR